MQVTIAGEQVDIARNSFSVADAIDQRTVCVFRVVDKERQWQFRKGQQVVVTTGGAVTVDGDVLVNDGDVTVNSGDITVDGEGSVSSESRVAFSGYVEDAEQEEPSLSVRFHTITAVDHHYLADKRLVARSYEMLEASEIVKNLYIRYLKDEGVVLGNIDLGPVIDRVVFSYVTVAEAIDEMAERAGFWWYITPGKVLEFRRRDSFQAPWTLTDADVSRNPAPKLRHAAPDYRNTQWVRNVKDLTDVLTERFRGDGEQRTFNVAYDLATAPTIRKFGSGILGSGQPQTVGVRGVDDDADWFWSRASTSISQGSGRDVLGAGDVLQVTYTGQFDIVVKSEDQIAIADRQNVEGGTGIVEMSVSDRRIEGRHRAFNLAASKLEQFGVMGRTLTFTTRRSGLRPGMLLTVETVGLFPDLRQRISDVFNIRFGEDGRGQLLVVGVSVFDVDGVELRYTVTAVEGPQEESWAKFFGRLYKVPDILAWSENVSDVQIVTRMFEFEKDWEESEVPNPFRVLYPADDLFVLDDPDPTIATFPMFDFDDRFTHVEVMAGGQVLGRKRLTQRVGLDTDEVTSTVYLGPNDVNGDVSSIRWFGGVNATDEVGSGIHVATETLVDTKTSAEAWNVVRTDSRWV